MRLLAFLLVMFCAGTALAENPYLPAAVRLYESFDYEAAMDQLNRARTFPGTTPQELVKIEMYTGLLKFELDDIEGARLAFRTALSLDPAANVPNGISPKVRAEWNSIKKQIAKIRVPENETKQPAAKAPQPAPAAAPAPQIIVLAPSKPAPPVNLAPVESPTSPLVASLEPEPPRKSPGPYFVLGGAAVLAGAGGVFGMLSKSAESSGAAEPVQVKENDLYATAHSRAVVANVLYGVAAAAAVGGVIWLLSR
jgi:hypothetical protein